MIERLHKYILIAFIAYLGFVNLMCFVTTFNPKALLNPFYVQNRTVSIGYLLKHIVLVSGVAVNPVDRDTIDEIAAEAGNTFGIDPELVKTVITVESEYRRFAISRTGAMGLMQLMPATFAEMGYDDPFDIRQNIMAGAEYLSKQLQAFSTLELALSAYNAGPTRIRRIRTVPDFIETRAYISKILIRYEPGQNPVQLSKEALSTQQNESRSN